jgi:hypothetical protein
MLDRKCASAHFELFGMEAPDRSQMSPPACPGDFRKQELGARIEELGGGVAAG